MKHLTLLLSLALAATGMAESANDFFKKGEEALAKGNIEAAKSAYSQALKIDPTHGNAKFRLLSMRDLTANARVNLRKKKLASIKLETVAFEDLTLLESLEALNAMVGKATSQSFEPNFIVDDPEQKISDNLVNLKLRNIPAHIALKYVLSQAKAKDQWDEHVIRVRPLASGSSAAPAQAVEK